MNFHNPPHKQFWLAAIVILAASACRPITSADQPTDTATQTEFVVQPHQETPEATYTPSPEDQKTSSWELHFIANWSGGPDGVRLLDANGDGLMDVATSFESSGDVNLFLHPGVENLGAEWPSVIVGQFPRGEDAFGMVLDNYVAMDIVSAHEGDTLGMYVHWGPSDPAQLLNPEAWQTELIPTTQGKAWMYAIPMDVNLDGHLDIVLGAKDDYYNERNAVGDLGWLESPTEDQRNLNNWIYHTIDHAGWPMSIIAHDVDRDADMDILLTDRNSDEEHMGARWLENPGVNWEDEWISHFLTGLKGSRPGFMSIGNFDGDEDMEYVFSLWQEEFLALVNEETKELFPITVKSNNPEIGRQKGVQADDIDLDGFPDLVLTFEDGPLGIGWMKFQDSPLTNNWFWNTIYDIRDAKFDQPVLHDVDLDGDLDVLTTEEVQGLGVIWFENPTIDLGNLKPN